MSCDKLHLQFFFLSEKMYDTNTTSKINVNIIMKYLAERGISGTNILPTIKT